MFHRVEAHGLELVAAEAVVLLVGGATHPIVVPLSTVFAAVGRVRLELVHEVDLLFVAHCFQGAAGTSCVGDGAGGRSLRHAAYVILRHAFNVDNNKYKKSPIYCATSA